jgi:hypothetical protein
MKTLLLLTAFAFTSFAQTGRTVAILIDAAGLSSADLQRASEAITRVVEKMQPGDKFALMISTDHGVFVRQDFTGDREALKNAAKLIGSGPAGAGNDRWAATLESSVRMLMPVAGKKALIYMTNAPALTPEQAAPLIGEAQRAEVAFYPVSLR